ncbi:pyridoxamine 5'-phosphate oxidase family protein [Amycolatopsis sp. cmx-4-61]|uniref:pyridoxamine 5'-phosphate oxidase family protein n=1 Tax=Amycolatopsis sp. cmx-4-61 TaxID=2790937 RepID=UPI003978B43C
MIDEFLALPLTARVATDGPTVRPTWYLWEEGAFWILSGPWSRLPALVRARPRIAVCVDVCELGTGVVRQVLASGEAAVRPFDAARGRRKLVRYLGAEEERWDPRFREYLRGDVGAVWVYLRPSQLVAKDLSYEVSSDFRASEPDHRAPPIPGGRAPLSLSVGADGSGDFGGLRPGSSTTAGGCGQPG